jgi:hypothetical protein
MVRSGPAVPTAVLRRLLSLLVLAGVIGMIGFITYRYYRNLYELDWSDIRDMAAHGLRQVTWMVALASATLLAVAAAVCIQSLAGRWRKVRVFVSYKHDHLPLVTALASALDNRWMTAEFVPFAPAEHDSLIDAVRVHVRRADAVVVLPGAEKSFVDAEVFAAAALRKVVMFIRVTDEQTTPDTAFTGYPVFDLGTLTKNSYAPLIRFILYVTRSARDVPRDFFRASAGFHKDLAAIAVVLFVAMGLVDIVGELAGAINPRWQMNIVVAFYWVTTVLAAVIFASSYLRTVYRRIKAIRVARQSVLSRTCTFPLLSESLSFLEEDRKILASLSQQPLALRY